MNILKSLNINLLSLIFALILAILILFLPKFLPDKVPLFYSLPWGDSQLAKNFQVLIIPLSIASITLINLIISWQLHESQIFFKKILKFISLLSVLILTTTLIKIILIFI